MPQYLENDETTTVVRSNSQALVPRAPRAEGSAG